MIDWTKPIQTRDGEPAELFFTHCSYVTEAYQRWCVINKGTPKERLYSYAEDGRHYSLTSRGHDIVNVPEEKVLGYIAVTKFEKLQLYLNARDLINKATGAQEDAR